ncbi:glycerophosphodiester phosphodiesterase [Priestia aryabhattai]
MNTSIDLYAHRGFSGRYPENTMIAFEEARKMQVAGIELDVQLTKDGEIVVIHDERIDRTTNGMGYVQEFSYKQLRLFDAGSWYDSRFSKQSIPTLVEVFEWMTDKKTKLTVNIELKNDRIYYLKLEEKVLRLIDEFDLEDQVILSSFNYDSLAKVRSLHSYIPTGFLFEGVSEEAIGKAKSIGAHLHCDMSFALSPYGKKAKQEGLDLRVYTINEMEDLLKLQQASVEVVMTDYPNRFSSIMFKG